ncbi:MAG: rhamnulokinase [Fermentimonas sp.]|nr:rhamnulokinase [Fermentimonas sp.]
MNKIQLKQYLAIDIGASSGRSIVGIIKDDRVELNEITRFQNPMIEFNNHIYWDLYYLYDQIIKSIKESKQQGYNIASLGIDTWGVDFVCFGSDGKPLRMPSSYRDTSTFSAPDRFYAKISKKELYHKTGIQIMNFNSLFQLDTQLNDKSSIYPVIDKILFMPDALSYMLTGKMVTEYTIASTSQMINPYLKEFDEDILAKIKLTNDNFAPIVFPGTKVGELSDSVKKQTDMDEVAVIAVAGHDTASAVLATPAGNENFAYLSSGTWSLMGIETKNPVINEETYNLNFTNEGGADGSIRLLKNICGMWLIERCKKEWDAEFPLSYTEIVEEAEKSPPFASFINPDAQCFANPESMIEAIKNYCKETGQIVPITLGEIARCIYESLALRYRQVLENLQKLADFPVQTLHIIGGGSKNNMLNQFTANAIGIEVVSGPSEATAMGNILMQVKAAGMVKDKIQIRDIVRNSTNLEKFTPQESEKWNTHYQKYLDVDKTRII